jgi:hypothetical protein
MKLLMVAFFVAVPGLFAQGRGGGVRSAAPARRPVAAPGRGTAPTVAAPVAAGVRPVAGGPVAGAPVYVLGYYPNPFFYGGSNYATAPVADPGAAAYYGDPSQQYAPQGSPAVIVNPNYTPETSNPVLRVYTYDPQSDAAPPEQTITPNVAAPEAAPPSVIFLIAMKDHTIYPAIAYWVEDGTLNYITQQGVRNRVSLDLVDRDFSVQLNKEREIDFAIPAVK